MARRGDKGGEAEGDHRRLNGILDDAGDAEDPSQDASGLGPQQDGPQDHRDVHGGGLDDHQGNVSQEGHKGQEHHNGGHQGELDHAAGVGGRG